MAGVSILECNRRTDRIMQRIDELGTNVTKLTVSVVRLESDMKDLKQHFNDNLKKAVDEKVRKSNFNERVQLAFLAGFVSLLVNLLVQFA